MTTSDLDHPLDDPDQPIGLSLDAIVDGCSWSDHKEALGRWKQGDLIRGVPITWIAPAGVDSVTNIESPDPDTGPVVTGEVFDAIVCSQTCDLGAGPPGDRHPMVLVAPLVQEDGIRSRAHRKLAAEAKLGYLVQVLPPSQDDCDQVFTEPGSPNPADGPTTHRRSVMESMPADQRWYADLRLLVPLSKALLVDRAPVNGFVTEAESLAFGEILAQKFRRPALHEDLSEAVPKVLTEFVRNSGKSKQCFAKVEQVRLLITHGDRLNPERAQLMVLTSGGSLSDDEQLAWSGLHAKVAPFFKAQGMGCGPLVHYDVARMSAEQYRRTVPIRCDLIGHARWP